MNVHTKSKTDENSCAVCKTSAEKKCTGCNSVYYCGRDHQKSDWKTHSKNCRLFELVDDPMVGRRYIATRRIEIEDIVLREDKPLLVAPYATRTNPISCLNCYVPLVTPNDTKHCDNCGLPMCLNCTRHGPECELMLKYRRKKLRKEECMTIWSLTENERVLALLQFEKTIIVLRALALRENHPKAYQRLSRLQGYFTEEPIFQQTLKLAKFVKKFLNIKDLDETELAKIIGIMGNNSFKSLPNGHSTLFDKASYFEHSCRPNCSANVCDDIITIRAVLPIPKGHPITISYGATVGGIAENRRFIAQTRRFDCCCERCKDPTEFGTMFSAIKCNNNECTGYILPPTFSVPNGEKIPDFVCDKCNVKRPSDVIDTSLKGISEEYLKIPRESVIELKRFIDKNEKILHENHYKIFLAKVALAHAITSELEIVTPEILKENIKLCEKLNYLMETLMPNQYLARGANLYRTFLCSQALIYKERLSCKMESLSRLRESKKVLIKACRLLSHHHDPLVKQEPERDLVELCELDVALERKISNLH